MWSRTPARDQETESGADPAPSDDVCHRLRSALDGIREGIVVCDAEGSPLFSNSAAHGLVDDRAGSPLLSQAVAEVVAEALRGERPERPLSLIAPVRRSFSIRAFPTEGPDGCNGAVAVVEDVSERHRLESVRRDFVANVSHELKTPTGALILLAETLEAEPDPQVVARLVRRVGDEAERLSRIIDDLLDLSRIEVNQAPSRLPVEVDRLVTEAVDRLAAVAAGLQVDILTGPVPAAVVVAGDRRDLVSALSNLVDNAVRYSEPGGEVTVQVHQAGREVHISVADSGVGIPARDLERIFERFYRVDRARSRHTGGTGLGLSIVRHVAANHGGRVRVRSVEGQGSTFVLELPVFSGAEEEMDG